MRQFKYINIYMDHKMPVSILLDELPEKVEEEMSWLILKSFLGVEQGFIDSGIFIYGDVWFSEERVF